MVEFMAATSSPPIRWCQNRELEVGIRLLTGPGGQGKTRLARHLADHMLRLPPAADTVGWVCGFLKADADEQALAMLADTHAPLLVLVDYAETRSDQLQRLLPLLWDTDTNHPVRVVLLARAAGEWWTRLTWKLEFEPDDVTVLGALGPAEDRAAQFRAALCAFASRLDDKPLPMGPRCKLAAIAPGSRPPPLRLPLTLQLAALAGLLETRQPLSGAAGRARAEDTMLRHEERYWVDTARSAGLDLSDVVLRRVVARRLYAGLALSMILIRSPPLFPELVT